jgi:RNA polymerase sigma factor, sigma-70 family/RNA polymerase sigma-70 factor, sigma-E family
MTKPSDRDESFSTFFSAHAEDMRRLAVFLTGDPEQGRDAAQEALVRTYRHWSRIKGEDPVPYTKRIVVNLVRSAHRRKIVAIRHAKSTPPDPGIQQSSAGKVDDWLVVSGALLTLPPVRRAAIVMRYYEDMSEADIARVLDRPLNTIKSDIHRGLKRLRPLLEEAVRT